MIAEPPLDAPDEDWLVWADAMQQVGDPRGELIALAAYPARRDELVRRHAKALLGPELGRHVRKGYCIVTRWRRYLPDAIEVRITDGRDGPQLVTDVLRHAPRVRELAIAGVASPHASEPVDLTATLGWLREARLPPSLTALALIDDRARAVDHLVSRDWEPGDNLVVFGPLAGLWNAFAPQLEQLALVVADPGQIQFQSLRLPVLRSFTLDTLAWADGLGDMLANARWPNLRSLALRLCDRYSMNNPDDARAYRSVYRSERERDPVGSATTTQSRWREELAPVLASIGQVPLERLALTSFADVYGVFDAIGEAAFPPSLVELDFSDSGFDDVAAARLADHAVMRQLKRLVLERVRLASPRKLAGSGVEIVHSCAPAAPTYRFIVGWE